jgi:hypothetical protein
MAARDGLALLWSANPAQSLGRPLGHLRQHAHAAIVQAVVGLVTAFVWVIYLNVFLESIRCRRPLHQSMSSSAA